MKPVEYTTGVYDGIGRIINRKFKDVDGEGDVTAFFYGLSPNKQVGIVLTTASNLFTITSNKRVFCTTARFSIML